MLKLESIQAFAAIADARSISAAARRLSLSKSVVSERLAELERGLGAKLIHRTTRTLVLTEDGNAFRARAQRILSEVNEAASELAERRGNLAGVLRISAPVSFGILHLGPALYGFRARNPAIELTLDLDDRFVDIASGGYDVVVRHGPVDDNRVIVKRLARSRRLLVASSDYCKRHGTPGSLQELAQHQGIIYSNRGAADWRFHSGRKFVTVRPHSAISVNNGLVMRDAAIAGLGIALLASFILHEPTKNKVLKAIDVGAEPEGATIYIAYPQHLRSSAKVRALTAWLQQCFGNPVYWEDA